MTVPALLASGRTADVYALDAVRMLRRYRAGGDVRTEAEVMRHLYARGYPVPRVHHADGRDLLLDRLSGPTLAEGSSGACGRPPYAPASDLSTPAGWPRRPRWSAGRPADGPDAASRSGWTAS